MKVYLKFLIIPIIALPMVFSLLKAAKVSVVNSSAEKLVHYSHKNIKYYLTEKYKNELLKRPGVKIIAFATFPANDINPGSGNGFAIFKRESKGYMLKTPYSFPLKVAARKYNGKHTGYRNAYLMSPVGIFGVHRGTSNGSKYMSWTPSVQKSMAKANFVPAFGLKVPDRDKPQKHFSYAIHTVPTFYSAATLKKRQYNSLGCYSLLAKDMRILYKAFYPLPTSQRLMIAVYDTMSISVKKNKIYIYRDLYKRNSNTVKNFINEIKKNSLNPKSFDMVKVKKMLDDSKNKYLQIYSLSDLR